MDKVNRFPLTLVDIEAVPNLRLQLKLKYTDPRENCNIMLESGVIYDVVYLRNGTLCRIIGRITGVSKVQNLVNVAYPRKSAGWLIRIDGSSENAANVIDIMSTQIRKIRKYCPHIDEDNTIRSGLNVGGITYGTINKVRIENIEIDDNTGEITGGDIISGEIPDPGNMDIPKDPTKGNSAKAIAWTEGGMTRGYNAEGNEVVVVNGQTYKGTITKGRIVAGRLAPGYEIDYEGNYRNATITDAIIVEGIVRGGTTFNGYIIDCVISDAVITGGTRTGSEMITTGATVVGNIAIGGTTRGGVLRGGTATGDIGGSNVTITNCNTRGTIGVSTGGTLRGGEILEGTQSGNIITNAVIRGGTLTGGTTIGAEAVPGGEDSLIIPGGTGTITIDTPVKPPEKNTKYDPLKHMHKYWDGLVVFMDNNGRVGSNLGPSEPDSWDGRKGDWVITQD